PHRDPHNLLHECNPAIPSNRSEDVMAVAENPQAVLNQPPPLENYNLYTTNPALVEAVNREGADWAHERCVELGEGAGGEPLEWEPRMTALEYGPRMIPADRKRGALVGMAMTEKQGGSDVRANITRATPLNGGGPGAEYEINGHKWFCSAPMCDAFLVLAQTDAGPSCFLLPRWTPDGERNAFHIQRLKDKMGNRSNASSEVEFDGAWARLIGEEGRGVQAILEMVNHTRLDCVIGSAAMMRQALAQAMHHCAHRAAFGKKLVEQ